MDNLFDELELAVASKGPQAAIDLLAERSKDDKNYGLLFQSRLLQARYALGMAPIETGPDTIPPEQRESYEASLLKAAHEAGELFLSAGNIGAAWPYFRAIGDTKPIFDAVEDFSGGDELDAVIEIAFHHGVNPSRGFELILEHRGLCRAITFFGGYQDRATRQQSLRLLVGKLYDDLAANITRTISEAESSPPAATSLAELIAGRPWLFEGMSYYSDPSHVVSILSFSIESDNIEVLRKAAEMADYGKQLSHEFDLTNDPPFEDTYVDYGFYLRALLGENVDEAVAHFRAKLPEYVKDGIHKSPAAVVVNLLVRVERFQEAVAISREYLADDAGEWGCPTIFQLCQMAASYDQLRQIARERGDLLAFTAGVIQK